MKLLVLLALVISGAVAETAEEIVRELRATESESPHGSQFLLCSETPWVRTLEVNFFNLINPTSFLNGNAKPILEEMSPVVLNELRSRANCSVNIEDMSINYGQSRYYSIKSGDFSQIVNTANIPFQRIGHVLCNDPNLVECMPSLVNSGEGYIKEGTISELLINGVDITAYNNELNRYSHIKGDLPELEKEKFSILSQLYYPKKFTVSSDDDTYGKIMLMDDQSELIWWKDNNAICSQFPSTTGDSFLGKINEQSVLHYYSEDICGTAILTYDSVDNSFGFPALKFVSYPESNGGSCFKTAASFPYGAIDVKGCQRDLPFVMSYPHFLEADSSYSNQLQGMSPQQSKHQSYFIIEPTTGMLVESSQKYQLNVDIKKFASHDNIEGKSMTDTILPVYWFNKKYTLDDTHISAIKSMLENPQSSTTTTAAPTVAGSSDEQFRAVDLKLNAISDKLSLVSFIVLAFVIIAVLILSVFSFIQFRHNKKILLRDQGLPKYAPPYEVKH